MTYALDTNAIIHLLIDTTAMCSKFDAAVARGDHFIIPPLVHYEMRRGFLCKSAPKKEKAYEQLTKLCPIGTLSAASLEQGAKIYADLYHKKLTVEDSDLLIGAFCIDGGYTLITGNLKHFSVIDGLAYEDWTV